MATASGKETMTMMTPDGGARLTRLTRTGIPGGTTARSTTVIGTALTTSARAKITSTPLMVPST